MALRAGYKGIKKDVADGLNSLNSATELATNKEVEEAVGVTELVHSDTLTVAAGGRETYSIPTKVGYVVESVTAWARGSGATANATVSLIGTDKKPELIACDNRDTEQSHSWTVYANVTYKKVSS